MLCLPLTRTYFLFVMMSVNEREPGYFCAVRICESGGVKVAVTSSDTVDGDTDDLSMARGGR